MSRYTLDERVGIVAIRDKQHPAYIAEGGLHADDPDVVAYAMGKFERSDNGIIWSNDMWKIHKLAELCGLLNRLTTYDVECPHCDTMIDTNPFESRRWIIGGVDAKCPHCGKDFSYSTSVVFNCNPWKLEECPF